MLSGRERCGGQIPCAGQPRLHGALRNVCHFGFVAMDELKMRFTSLWMNWDMPVLANATMRWSSSMHIAAKPLWMICKSMLSPTRAPLELLRSAAFAELRLY